MKKTREIPRGLQGAMKDNRGKSSYVKGGFGMRERGTVGKKARKDPATPETRGGSRTVLSGKEEG